MSFVNQGNYNDACQYYLRGLNLNPEAVHVWNYLRTALSLLDRMVCAPVALPVSPFADATRVLRIWWRRAIRTTLKRSRGSLTLPDLSKCVDVQWTFVIRRSYLLRHACDQIPDACERRGGEAARGGGCTRAQSRGTAEARGARRSAPGRSRRSSSRRRARTICSATRVRSRKPSTRLPRGLPAALSHPSPPTSASIAAPAAMDARGRRRPRASATQAAAASAVFTRAGSPDGCNMQHGIGESLKGWQTKKVWRALGVVWLNRCVFGGVLLGVCASLAETYDRSNADCRRSGGSHVHP